MRVEPKSADSTRVVLRARRCWLMLSGSAQWSVGEVGNRIARVVEGEMETGSGRAIEIAPFIRAARSRDSWCRAGGLTPPRSGRRC